MMMWAKLLKQEIRVEVLGLGAVSSGPLVIDDSNCEDWESLLGLQGHLYSCSLNFHIFIYKFWTCTLWALLQLITTLVSY